MDENKILDEQVAPEEKLALKELRAQKRRNRFFTVGVIFAGILIIILIVELIFIFKDALEK